MLYLDTSAIRQLSARSEHADLKTELVRCNRPGMFCTSVLAIEELITSTSSNIDDWRKAMVLAKTLVPTGLMWHWHPIVAAWVEGVDGPELSIRVEHRPWDDRLMGLSAEQVAAMRSQQEESQERARLFREAVGGMLSRIEDLKEMQKGSGYWSDPRNVIREAEVHSRILLENPGNLGALMHSIGRISHGIDLQRLGSHQWVRFCARHLMVGVLRRKYGRACDDSLRGELYDNMHIAFCSAAGRMITQDKWLMRSLSPLPGAGGGAAKAIGLDDLRVYLRGGEQSR